VQTNVKNYQDDEILQIDRATLTAVSKYHEDRQANQMAFSYSGEELFLTTGEGLVKIFAYPSMELLHTLTAHTSACYCVEVAPSGAYVATGGSDAIMTLWDTTSWICKRTFDKSVGTVAELSFSCDGAYIVGGSEEGTGLDIAHVESGEYVHRIETPGTVPHVQWSPKDYALAYAPGEGAGGLKILGFGAV
jgi:THO complex subunit 3